jgi:hypothetical protein
VEQTVGALDVADREPASDAVLAAAAQDPPDDDRLESLVRRVLLGRTRQPDCAPV